jgi:hypothetical protein
VRFCPFFCPDFDQESLRAFQEAVFAEMKPLNYERGMVIAHKCHVQEDVFFLVKGQVTTSP